MIDEFWQDMFLSKKEPQNLMYLNPLEKLEETKINMQFSLEKLENFLSKISLRKSPV